MRATRLVTVLLPLVPVTPMTGARTARAKSSMSPNTSMPRARACDAIGSSSETPGDINTCDAPSSSDKSNPPRRMIERPGQIAEFGEPRRRACAYRWPLTGIPRFAKIAQARCPRLAEADYDAGHQRIFKVARPANTSMKLMIQKRTMTLGSDHPLSSK